MISVIYEDENFIGLSKPAGMLLHETVKSKEQIAKSEGTLVDWLVKNYPEVKNVGDAPQVRPGIVHRLDKETSGVLVVARNQKSFEYLKKLFQEHKIIKKYIALVHGRLEGNGVINAPIGLKPGTVKRSIRAKNMKMVKEAVTEYKSLKNFEKDGEFFTLVELTPKTGRTHQLRVHLASISHPVVGDILYGPKSNSLGMKRQFLHANSLEFVNQEGTRLRLEAGLPRELEETLSAL